MTWNGVGATPIIPVPLFPGTWESMMASDKRTRDYAPILEQAVKSLEALQELCPPGYSTTGLRGVAARSAPE